MPFDWSPLWPGLRYAGASTLLAILAALPLAWLLVNRRFPGSQLLDAAANLPLVLPPAVLVYYLLSALGRWTLRFNWNAAVVVSAIYTLPLLLRMARAVLAAADHTFENAARGLGAGEWRIFRSVTLPLTWRGLLAALLTGFVRAFADCAATAIVASHTASWWLLLPVGALALAVLYFGNWLGRGVTA